MTRPIGTALAESVVESGYASLVLDRLAKQTCQVIDVDSSSILVSDREKAGMAVAVAGCGGDEDKVGSRLDVSRELIGEVLDSGRPATSRAPATRAPRNISPQGAHVRAAVALRCVDRVVGVLGAGGEHDRRLTRRELGLLCELAEVAGPALAHAEGRSDALASVEARVCELVEAIDEFDGYTAGHSAAVVGLSCALGERLRLDLPALLELELAALLHDLGKVGVPGAILMKPGPLDPDERDLMQLHPVWGAEMLAGVSGLEPVGTIVRFHHERWDGHGYPDGLAGERIPLAARMVAVCDAYHAMTSDRSYRAALGPQQAVAELRAHAGRQFDPAVVNTFVSLLDELADSGLAPDRLPADQPASDRPFPSEEPALDEPMLAGVTS